MRCRLDICAFVTTSTAAPLMEIGYGSLAMILGSSLSLYWPIKQCRSNIRHGMPTARTNIKAFCAPRSKLRHPTLSLKQPNTFGCLRDGLACQGSETRKPNRTRSATFGFTLRHAIRSLQTRREHSGMTLSFVSLS